MNSIPGDSVHPGDPKFGCSVYCPSTKCPAQDVSGHGKNEKEAFETVTDKFRKSRD